MMNQQWRQKLPLFLYIHMYVYSFISPPASHRVLVFPLVLSKLIWFTARCQFFLGLTLLCFRVHSLNNSDYTKTLDSQQPFWIYHLLGVHNFCMFTTVLMNELWNVLLFFIKIHSSSPAYHLWLKTFNDIWYKRIDTEYQMVRFIVYKIKFCLGLYSRDGSSYNLSNIILYFQYLIDSTLNSQNIDTFLENVILKQ